MMYIAQTPTYQSSYPWNQPLSSPARSQPRWLVFLGRRGFSKSQSWRQTRSYFPAASLTVIDGKLLTAPFP